MPGQAGFDFNKMISSLNTYTDAVKTYITALENKSTSGTVDLSTMFALQFQMQIMSQYIEAMSNVLSATHNEMMTMARATKGQ